MTPEQAAADKERDRIVAWQKNELAKMKANSRDTHHWFWSVVGDKIFQSIQSNQHRKDDDER